MAGYQYAHLSPLSIVSIRSNSILNSSMFYSLGASRIFMSSCSWPQDYMFYACMVC